MLESWKSRASAKPGPFGMPVWGRRPVNKTGLSGGFAKSPTGCTDGCSANSMGFSVACRLLVRREWRPRLVPDRWTQRSIPGGPRLHRGRSGGDPDWRVRYPNSFTTILPPWSGCVDCFRCSGQSGRGYGIGAHRWVRRFSSPFKRVGCPASVEPQSKAQG